MNAWTIYGVNNYCNSAAKLIWTVGETGCNLYYLLFACYCISLSLFVAAPRLVGTKFCSRTNSLHVRLPPNVIFCSLTSAMKVTYANFMLGQFENTGLRLWRRLLWTPFAFGIDINSNLHAFSIKKSFTLKKHLFKKATPGFFCECFFLFVRIW